MYKNNKRLTTEEFIIKSKAIYGDQYDYSKVSYINNKTYVTLICKKHGKFSIRPDVHLFGKRKRGCQECGREKDKQYSENLIAKHKHCFVEKARKIHGDKYDYSKSDYIGSKEKIIIICKTCGKEFKQTPNEHLLGRGCPHCASKNNVERLAKINRSNTKEFIEKAKKIHGNKYDYSKVEYKKWNVKVCIICPKHGEFNQVANDHLAGAGCPLCNESRGEREIRNWLTKHNVNFISQYNGFKELIGIGGSPLVFDFYLPDNNMCIEFDGIQHREWVKGMMSKKQFLNLQEHDRRKNEFCIKNGIKLIRIWRDGVEIKADKVTMKKPRISF